MEIPHPKEVIDQLRTDASDASTRALAIASIEAHPESVYAAELCEVLVRSGGMPFDAVCNYVQTTSFRYSVSLIAFLAARTPDYDELLTSALVNHQTDEMFANAFVAVFSYLQTPTMVELGSTWLGTQPETASSQLVRFVLSNYKE